MASFHASNYYSREKRECKLAKQDLATLNIETLTPLSPEVISRQATINIGISRSSYPSCDGILIVQTQLGGSNMKLSETTVAAPQSVCSEHCALRCQLRSCLRVHVVPQSTSAGPRYHRARSSREINGGQSHLWCQSMHTSCTYLLNAPHPSCNGLAEKSNLLHFPQYCRCRAGSTEMSFLRRYDSRRSL